MKKNIKLKILIDLGMTCTLLASMSYLLIGEKSSWDLHHYENLSYGFRLLGVCAYGCTSRTTLEYDSGFI